MWPSTKWLLCFGIPSLLMLVTAFSVAIQTSKSFVIYLSWGAATVWLFLGWPAYLYWHKKWEMTLNQKTKGKA